MMQQDNLPVKITPGTEEEGLLYRDLTYAIIGAAMFGAAMEVHKVLGPGFLENVYENALVFEFGLRHIACQQQVNLIVLYKGKEAGRYTADLVVNQKVLVELKAEKTLSKVDEAQLFHYLKTTGFRIGLLINFGAESLQHTRRIV
jgi:GxxExxY protein